MNFFEQSEYAMNSEESISEDDVHYPSEEDRNMALMRETKIRTFMQMKLEACGDELDWLIGCHNCAAFNCPEEYPPRPLPIPRDIDNLQRKLGKAKKGILPPTLNTIPKAYYYLPAGQAPVHPQQQQIPSWSQEEKLETSLEVQPDDMMGNHRDGEHNPLEVVSDGTSSTDQGGISYFKPRLG